MRRRQQEITFSTFRTWKCMLKPLALLDGLPGPARDVPGSSRWRDARDGAQIVRNELQIYVSRMFFLRLPRTRPGGTGEPQMEGGRGCCTNRPKLAPHQRFSCAFGQPPKARARPSQATTRLQHGTAKLGSYDGGQTLNFCNTSPARIVFLIASSSKV